MSEKRRQLNGNVFYSPGKLRSSATSDAVTGTKLHLAGNVLLEDAGQYRNALNYKLGILRHLPVFSSNMNQSKYQPNAFYHGKQAPLKKNGLNAWKQCHPQRAAIH